MASSAGANSDVHGSAGAKHEVASRGLAVLLLPWVVLGMYAVIQLAHPAEPDPGPPAAAPAGAGLGARTVFVMVDSLPRGIANDEEAMPTLARWRATSLHGDLLGALPASTVPCVRTMLEGNVAGYLANLQNFVAARAGPSSWPVIAHRAGLRVAVVSSHGMHEMFSDIAVEAVHLGRDEVPYFERDERAADLAVKWLDDDTADVLLVHLLDLDQASHVYHPGTPAYFEQIRQVDHALARIAAALRADDNLVVTSDHGHDRYGNHDELTSYLARGPAFRPGRIDLQQPTIALLLAVASGTRLPATYEGEVPTEAFRTSLAAVLAPGDRADAVQAITARRNARAAHVRRSILGFVPWLLAALVALAWVARRRPRAGGLPFAALLAVFVLLAAGAAWTGYGWGSSGRPWLWAGPWVNIVHFGCSLALCGGVLTALLRRFAKLSVAAAAGASLLVLPLLIHLPSKDYFSSVYTAAHLLAPATVLLLLPALRRRPALLAVATACVSALLLRTSLPEWITAGGAWVGLPAVAAGAAGVVFASDGRLRPLRWAVLVAVLVVLAEPLDLGWGPTTLVAFIAATGGLVVRALREQGIGGPHLHGAVAAAVTFLAMWVTVDQNLMLLKIRFEFAYRLAYPHPMEALVAAQLAAFTSLKYGLAPLLVLIATSGLDHTGSRRTYLTLLILKPLLVGAWVVGARLDIATRHFEGPLEEAIVLGFIPFLTFGALLAAEGARSFATWGVSWLRARARPA